MGYKLIALCLVAALFSLTTGGCRKGSTRRERSAAKPPRYSAEELAEGFVVSLLRASKPIRVEDGAHLGQPMYEFFLTVTNPDDEPKELVFSSNRMVDLRVIRGESEIYRYSLHQRARSGQTRAEVGPKSKRMWPLKWNGRLADGSYPPDGAYTLIFILDCRPAYEYKAEGVYLDFPGDETMAEEEEPDIEGDGEAGG